MISIFHRYAGALHIHATDYRARVGVQMSLVTIFISRRPKFYFRKSPAVTRQIVATICMRFESAGQYFAKTSRTMNNVGSLMNAIHELLEGREIGNMVTARLIFDGRFPCDDQENLRKICRKASLKELLTLYDRPNSMAPSTLDRFVFPRQPNDGH